MWFFPGEMALANLNYHTHTHTWKWEGDKTTEKISIKMIIKLHKISHCVNLKLPGRLVFLGKMNYYYWKERNQITDSYTVNHKRILK